MIDEPSNGKYFGGDVAAPVFAETVQQTLRMLGVQPDMAVKPQIQAHRGGGVVLMAAALQCLHTPADATRWLRSRVTGTLHTDSRQGCAGRWLHRVAGRGHRWPKACALLRWRAAPWPAGGARGCRRVRSGRRCGARPMRQLKPATGEIASLWFGEPSRQLDMLAVTGTNGKTSSAWWLAQALSNAEQTMSIPCGLGRHSGHWNAAATRQRRLHRVQRADHTRPGAAAAAPAPVCRRRAQGLRDRGVLHRHRRTPAGGNAAAGGGLHQPDSGPPGLPRQHGRLLGRQARPVRLAWPAGGGHQRRRCPWRRTGAVAARQRPLDLWTVSSRAPRPACSASDAGYGAHGLRFTVVEGE